MIQVVDGKSEVPHPAKLAEMAQKEIEGPFEPDTATVEPIILSRDYLLNNEYDYEIVIVPNSSIKQSEADKANKDLAFYQATAQNPQVDQEQNLKDFARAFGKDESIVKPALPATQDQLAAMMGGQPATPQQAPNIDMEQL